jgi:hypothetical protein
MTMGPGSAAKERSERDGGAAPAPPSCGACQRPISSHYFRAGDTILCEACRHHYELELAQRWELKYLARSWGFGLVAALAGATLWGGIIWFTGYELGLVAVVVGLMVGGAVKVGSGRRGGRPYQVTAVLLTYLAVSLAYVPLVIQGLQQAAEEEATALAEPEAAEPALPPLGVELADAPEIPADALEMPSDPPETPAAGAAGLAAPDSEATPSAGAVVLASLALLGFAAALPFLAGAENAIGLLIIGFALWEAWKMNALVDLSVAGPHRVGEAGAA